MKFFAHSIKQVFVVLGILVAICSVSSLVQNWTTAELGEQHQRILLYYRTVTAELKWLFLDWWMALLFKGFTLPAWTFDAATAWVICAAGVYRVIHRQLELQWNHEGNNKTKYQGWNFRKAANVVLPFGAFFRVLSDRACWLFAPRVTMEHLKEARARMEHRGVSPTREYNSLKEIRIEGLTTLAVLLAPLIGTCAFFISSALTIN